MSRQHSARAKLPVGLNPDDPGVELLREALNDHVGERIVLVGCGGLPIGGPTAESWIVDVRERSTCLGPATELWQACEGSGSRFDVAVVWPRAHFGKDFTELCIVCAAVAVRDGGSIYCAVRKSKGADSIAAFMNRVLGEVHVRARNRGYRLLQTRRAVAVEPEVIEQTCRRRYCIEDPVLGGLRLHAAPGVFSRRALDEGTRCLIRHLDGLDASPRAIIDLGAGVGPLGLWAAQRWPRARIFAVESNFMAAHLARTNAEGAGFSARYRVVESDGLPGVLPDGWSGPPIGGFDLAVCNPPTHADARELRALLEPLGSWLAAGAPAHFVVSRSALLERVLVQLGATFELSPYERYAIVRAVFPVGPGLPRRGSPRGAAATEVGPQRR